MRIGIPRALHTYYHYPLWQRFAEELGAEVEISPPTDLAILEQGIGYAPAEACLPLKAYLGHVAYLRNRCDILLLHRLVCVLDHLLPRFGCPKAIALPDIVRVSVPGLPPVVELIQDERKCPTAEALLQFGKHLDTDHRGRQALSRACLAQNIFEQQLRQGTPLDAIWPDACGPTGLADPPQPSGPRIAVIGHRYLIFDRLLSHSLPEILEKLGVTACYPFSAPVGSKMPELTRNRVVSWYYEQELLGAAWHYLKHEQIDGLLLASSFGCGTAPVVNEIVLREMWSHPIPVLVLLFDEHTAETAIITRLEAFVELARKRIRHRQNHNHPSSGLRHGL